MTEQRARWLPGAFRPLLHQVDESGLAIDLNGVRLLWATCNVPVLPWPEHELPDYSICPRCHPGVDESRNP